MNKLRPFLGTVLVAALAAAPAMAEDFYAVSQLSTGFTAMPEDQLASIEGTGPNTCVNRSCGNFRFINSFNPLANVSNVGNTTTTTTTPPFTLAPGCTLTVNALGLVIGIICV